MGAALMAVLGACGARTGLEDGRTDAEPAGGTCAATPDNEGLGPWRTELVDPAGASGGGVDVARDAAGCLFAVWQRDLGLRFATTEHGGWETVDLPASGGGWTPVIAAGPDRRLHVVSGVSSPGAREHLVREGGGWTVLAIPPLRSVFRPAIAVGPDGVLHLVAHEVEATAAPCGREVVHLTRDAVGWSAPEIIVADPGCGLDLAVAAASDGAIHIGLTPGLGSVAHAQRRGGAWELETLATTGTRVAELALDLDPEDRPWIAYSDLSRSELVVARRRGGRWRTRSIAELDSGTCVAIAVDAAGDPHVVWTIGHGDAPSDLFYARGTEPPERVAADVHEVGSECALVLRPTGAVDVLYLADDGLRHATNAVRPDGVDQNCDGVDGVDADGDGLASKDTGGLDCDDRDAAIGRCP